MIIKVVFFDYLYRSLINTNTIQHQETNELCLTGMLSLRGETEVVWRPTKYLTPSHSPPPLSLSSVVFTVSKRRTCNDWITFIGIKTEETCLWIHWVRWLEKQYFISSSESLAASHLGWGSLWRETQTTEWRMTAAEWHNFKSAVQMSGQLNRSDYLMHGTQPRPPIGQTRVTWLRPDQWEAFYLLHWWKWLEHLRLSWHHWSVSIAIAQSNRTERSGLLDKNLLKEIFCDKLFGRNYYAVIGI